MTHLVLNKDILKKDGFYITYRIDDGSVLGSYGVIFTARHPFEILRVSEVHETAGTAGSLNLEKLSDGQALDSGLTILKSDFDLTETANNVRKREKLDIQNTQFKEGERLALKDIGTPNGVTGIQITIYCKYIGRGDYA
ncbi:hypothetical protein [Persephonella sp.]